MSILNRKNKILVIFIISILVNLASISMLCFSIGPKPLLILILLISNTVFYIKLYSMISSYKNEHILAIKEMNHRIKNNINILTNIIDLKKYIYTDKDSQKLLNDLKNKTFLVSHIHEQIYTSANKDSIDLCSYIHEIIDMTNNFYDGNVEIGYSLDVKNIPSKDAVNIALITQEIFTNSIKYAYKDTKENKFYIDIKDNKNSYKIIMSDNGPGFDTGVLDKSDSFGMEMVKTIVKQYDGVMKFNGMNGMILNIVLSKVN